MMGERRMSVFCLSVCISGVRGGSILGSEQSLESRERRDTWTICPISFPDRIPFPLPVPSMLPRGWLWGALGLAANRTAAGQARIRCLRQEPTLCIPAPPLPLWPAGLPWDPGIHNPKLFLLFPRIQKSWLLGKGV